MIGNNVTKRILLNYNVGISSCNLILIKLGFNQSKKYTSIKKRQLSQITTFVMSNFLRRDQGIKIKSLNILNKINNGSYYGYKWVRGLQMYGKNTKVNCKTARKLNKWKK